MLQQSGGKTKPSWPWRVGGFSLRSRLSRSSPNPTARGAKGEAWGPLVAHPGVSAPREALKLECSGCVSSPGGQAPGSGPCVSNQAPPSPAPARCPQLSALKLLVTGWPAEADTQSWELRCSGWGEDRVPPSHLQTSGGVSGMRGWTRVPCRAGCSPPMPLCWGPGL